MQDRTKEFKEERKQIMDTFLKKSSQELLLLRRFKGEEKISIGFDLLSQFELNQWFEINSKVKVMLIEKSNNKLVFHTKMKKGGQFGWHFHSDCDELCVLNHGHLYCLETFKEADDKLEEIYYEAGEAHIPIALEDSSFQVIFNRVDHE